MTFRIPDENSGLVTFHVTFRDTFKYYVKNPTFKIHGSLRVGPTLAGGAEPGWAEPGPRPALLVILVVQQHCFILG